MNKSSHRLIYYLRVNSQMWNFWMKVHEYLEFSFSSEKSVVIYIFSNFMRLYILRAFHLLIRALLKLTMNIGSHTQIF